MPTAPGRAYEPEMTRGTAVIGKSVIIKGQIFAREDLLVDGEVEGGTIEAQEHRLTIGPNGKVNASVKARDRGAGRGERECGSLRENRHPQGRALDRRYQDGPHRDRGRGLFQRQHRYSED